jgi:hypothetical protein
VKANLAIFGIGKSPVGRELEVRVGDIDQLAMAPEPKAGFE